MMQFNNKISLFIARKRWLKRRLKRFLPSMVSYKLYDDLNFFFDPRDMSGPSFHFAYDLHDGFQNYEEQAKDELLETLPTDGTFYDIGANIGMFSVYFAKKRQDITILGFEPDQQAFTCLKSTFDSYRDRNIFLYNKGIGAINEDKKLFRSSINDGGHSFQDQYRLNENSDGEREYEVASVINLDQFVVENKLPLPQAIKIDVEGFELEVLKGSLETIKQAKPSMLIESSNSDLASQGPLWRILSELEESGLYAREVGSLKKLTLRELSIVAKKKLEKSIPLDNYFYQFDL